MQPELFAPDEARRVSALPHDQCVWTREPVDTSGLSAYAILVRAPGDPERRSREERHAAMGVAADVAPDNAEAALWQLKEQGVVEHTIDVPVLWRLTGGR